MARVYVGTYGKYNNGSIAGGWLDLADYSTYNDFLKACGRLHKNEHDPEFMIQDTEDFPDGLSCMEWLSEQDFNDVKQAMKEDNMPSLSIVDYSDKAFAVIGDTKAVKDDLKRLGGRFNGKLSCGAGWIFSNKSREAVEAFIATGTTIKKEATPNDKALLDDYLTEMRKVYKDGSMLDYARKCFSSAVRLQNGGILVFEKPSIETKFCFGYSDDMTGDDHRRAMQAAETARTEDYFLSRNLSDMDERIRALEVNCRFPDGEYNDYYGKEWYLVQASYASQTEPVNVYDFHALRDWDVKEHPSWYTNAQRMGDADRMAILEGLKRERDKFEKRLRAYLKRYGTSKLHTWTYWADE